MILSPNNEKFKFKEINDIKLINKEKQNNLNTNSSEIIKKNLIFSKSNNLITNSELEKVDSKEIFYLGDFKEESKEIIEEYICQICKCVSLKPFLLSKINIKK
jgi:hypothetical protein